MCLITLITLWWKYPRGLVKLLQVGFGKIKDIKRDSLAAEKTQPDLFPKDLSRARASLQGEANNLQTDISGNFGSLLYSNSTFG